MENEAEHIADPGPNLIFGMDWWLYTVRGFVLEFGFGDEIAHHPSKRDLDDFQALRRFLVRYRPQFPYPNGLAWEGWRRLTDPERARIALAIQERVLTALS